MIMRMLALSVLVLSLSCQAAPDGFLDIAGWTPRGEPATYDADGLWELINGAADTFLDYGFESVTVQNYSAGEVTAAVAVYDMGTPLNAFGIYRTEAPPEHEALPMGAEAVVSPPYQALLLKNRYYVKVEAYEGDIDRATGEALTAAIAEALPGADGLPPEFEALPADGMVAGSAQYTREALFGLAELDDCVHAAYAGNGGSGYRAFAMLQSDGAWEALATKWEAADLAGERAFFREVPYSGFVGVIRTPRGVIGVADAQNEEELFLLLARIAGR